MNSEIYDYPPTFIATEVNLETPVILQAYAAVEHDKINVNVNPTILYLFPFIILPPWLYDQF